MGYMKGFLYLLHHLFVPHHSNNYKAKSLHLSAIVFYIVLLIASQVGSAWVRQLYPNVLGYATDISVTNVLQMVNQRRLDADLSPLTISPELTTAANQKANDMFTKNYWAHISPTGTTPWVFITRSGYDYLYAGENLAKDFDKSQEVVDAWMNSSSHRANLLKPEYTDIGLAVVNGKLNGQDTTLVVQEFGSKTSKPQTVAAVSDAVTSSPAVSAVSVQTSSQPNLFSSLLSLKISKTVSLAVAEMMLIVLFIDSLYIWKYKTYRVSGHSLAHLLFIAALLGAMGATGVGVIL